MKWSSLTDGSVKLMPCDVVLVHGPSKMSQWIRFFSRSPGEARTFFNHVGLVHTRNRLIEATGTGVKLNDLLRYDDGKGEVLIARNRAVDDDTRLRMMAKAVDYLGRKYGWFKIGLQVVDWLLGQQAGRDVYAARRLAGGKSYVICSWLVAYVYEYGKLPFRAATRRATPDDIGDEILGSFVAENGYWVPVFATDRMERLLARQARGEGPHE